MAIDEGWDGAILLGSSNAAKSSEITQINEWNMEFTGDELEVTAFDSTYDRVYEQGMRSVVITFSGYSENDNVQNYAVANITRSSGPYSSTQVYFVLLTDNTTGQKAGYQGKAIITGLTRGATPDGLQTISGTLRVADAMSTYAS